MNMPHINAGAEIERDALVAIVTALRNANLTIVASDSDAEARAEAQREQFEHGFNTVFHLDSGAFRDGVKAGIADAEDYEDGFAEGANAGLIAGLKQRLGHSAPAAPPRPKTPDGDTFDYAYADGFEDGLKEAFSFVPDSGALGSAAERA